MVADSWSLHLLSLHLGSFTRFGEVFFWDGYPGESRIFNQASPVDPQSLPDKLFIGVSEFASIVFRNLVYHRPTRHIFSTGVISRSLFWCLDPEPRLLLMISWQCDLKFLPGSSCQRSPCTPVYMCFFLTVVLIRQLNTLPCPCRILIGPLNHPPGHIALKSAI